MVKPGDFYEDDEPIEKVEAAFENGTPTISRAPIDSIQRVRFTANEIEFLRRAAKARKVSVDELIRTAALEIASQPVVNWVTTSGPIERA